MTGQQFIHLIWLVPLALLILYIGSPRFLGTMGIARVRRILNTALEKNRYTVFHEFVLPAGGGTAQMDHVVVSRFGIWAIRSIHRGGWISGTEVQDRWTQKIAGRIHRFENPVHENYLRVQALKSALQLPDSRFQSLIVFSGQKGFKSALPANVIPVEKLVRKIRGQSRELLSPEEANQAVQRLHNAILKPPKFTRTARWKLLRVLLLASLLAGAYWVFKQPIDALIGDMQSQANMRMAPEKYTPNGVQKSPRQLYEDSLVCAYSAGTGRCACYEAGGDRASLDTNRCKELAERDSVLKR